MHLRERHQSPNQNNGNISFVRYSPHGSDPLLTAQLVECYRDVFADGPWHEWLKCQICETYWGTKDKDFLASIKYRHCGLPIADFWPREKVISDLFHEITPEASGWLAMDGNTVIGFCWGYPITVEKLEADLGIQLELGNHGRVAYQDDVGVLSAYRGRKIAKTMVANRLDDFLSQGLRFGVVRTRQNPEPSETFLWYTRVGYSILASYPEDDPANYGKVVLGRPLDESLRELLS